MWTDTTTTRFREITPSRQPEFVARGWKPSLFFPHRYCCLPKCGPDGYKLAMRMCGPVDPDAAWEIVLYAVSPQLDEFPAELFFDDDLVWHRQQFGLPGQIATANLVLEGSRLHTNAHVADVVQRIGSRREHKTRIEKLFKGWARMLLNAIMSFAQERGVRTVFTPGANFARQHTDPRRNPGAPLFERVYDRSVLALYRAAREGDWWAIDVDANRDRIVVPELRQTPARRDRTICICHDIERGLGHRDVEPAFAAVAEGTARRSLDAMLAAEADAGVKATYSVVGCLLAEERARIEPRGHALAFHSYDHAVAPPGGRDQLHLCRAVDYRVKGYRPPQSLLTPETGDEALLFHNFEWLASSRYSLGLAQPVLHRHLTEPVMHRRLVKLPIAFDDFALHGEGMPYDVWERRALEEIERSPFVAFGLHDCYAPAWLPHYPRFLDRVRALGTPRTLDDVAAEVTLGSAA
jgi:hypothetical protein